MPINENIHNHIITSMIFIILFTNPGILETGGRICKHKKSFVGECGSISAMNEFDTFRVKILSATICHGVCVSSRWVLTRSWFCKIRFFFVIKISFHLRQISISNFTSESGDLLAADCSVAKRQIFIFKVSLSMLICHDINPIKCELIAYTRSQQHGEISCVEAKSKKNLPRRIYREHEGEKKMLEN